ncbi:transmembrane amino acid transporter protein-domain-containing protein [Halteromyces radiatus]|uniref:transmembrane amino acid transporter protein-domain-containing protein n=1 Tax=Halteromyces radiatus TaxID=101107 RepID=UPI002220ECBA|nr:transmembrane amino acid transporter protein-domain-containing protein [Halteromyces radiatus]KAI8089843.1 transmembrane amino acid transporter protein-domain-containing protein [Halteromyces radiatus]
MSSIEKPSSTEKRFDITSVEEDYEASIRTNSGHGQCSSFMAYWNVVCVVAGTGTLGLPYALRQGGWFGLFILFLSWSMSIYTGIILVKCLYAKPGHRMSTFKEISTTCFGKVGGWVTFFFLAWILLGAPTLYMVLAGQNLSQLCHGTVAELNGTYWTIIMCVVIGIPFVLVKSMKEVAWMSAFGSVATVVVVLIVLIMACMDEKAQMAKGVVHDGVIWPQFPAALATISFSFGGNVIYPHVEASMARPKQWPWVIGAGLSTCAFLYILCAVPGYYIYGRDTTSPIYNNLPAGVGQTIAIVLITLHVLMAAPLLTTSLSLDLEDMFNITVERFGKWKEFFIRACLRIAIIVIVAIIACFVPYFSLLMGLIGSFSNCVLIFVFPVLYYFKLTGFRNKPIYEIAWCFLTIVLGIVGLIFGTRDAILGLIDATQHK